MSVLRLRNTLKAFLLVHLDSCVCRFEKKALKAKKKHLNGMLERFSIHILLLLFSIQDLTFKLSLREWMKSRFNLWSFNQTILCEAFARNEFPPEYLLKRFSDLRRSRTCSLHVSLRASE